jgi:outer membrane protein OmpA-like peptidoglycan-associated protein
MKSVSNILSILALTLATAACSSVTTYSEGPGSYPQQKNIEARQINVHHVFAVRQIPRTQIDAVVHFATASDKLSPEAQAQVRQMAEALRDPSLAGSHVIVAGYTDSVGKDAKNLQLSHHRALRVMQILVNEYHIPASMLSAEGYGKASPVASNATAEGRAANRRVGLVVLAPKR